MALARGTAEVLRYETEIGTVVVGDADVAAASVAQSDALVLTGLAEGNTNVIVLDGDGADMDRITLRVSAPGRRVELWHGLERDVRSCERFCPPADSADAAAGGAGTVDSAASP